MKQLQVGSLILSAGASSRMGTSKALLPWKNKSFIQHTIERSQRLGLCNITVVLGASAASVKKVVDPYGVRSVINENWALGMGSSIREGVKAVLDYESGLNGILIQLCDQPLITDSSLKRVINRFIEEPLAIVASHYENSLGVPVLFPKAMFAELLSLQEDWGAKKILTQFRHLVRPIAHPEASLDIDTPEDYRRLEKFGSIEGSVP